VVRLYILVGFVFLLHNNLQSAARPRRASWPLVRQEVLKEPVVVGRDRSFTLDRGEFMSKLSQRRLDERLALRLGRGIKVR